MARTVFIGVAFHVVTKARSASHSLSVIPPLVITAERDHTPTMTIKSAAFLALVGMILMTILVTVDFINVVLGVMRDVVPAMALLRSLIYLLASTTVTLFLFVFHKNQS